MVPTSARTFTGAHRGPLGDGDPSRWQRHEHVVAILVAAVQHDVVTGAAALRGHGCPTCPRVVPRPGALRGCYVPALMAMARSRGAEA